MKTRTLTVIILYILFIFGGLWHLLNVFQPLMRALAAPLIFAVAIALVVDICRSIEYKRDFLIWCTAIILAGVFIEYIGLRTGYPFGHYTYERTLQPQLGGVPLAIGFAWLQICIASIFIAKAILKNIRRSPQARFDLLTPLLAAFFMVAFDAIMERAAVKIDYWSWHMDIIPLANFISWYIIGVIFVLSWKLIRIPAEYRNSLAIHVYISQLLYFTLCLL